MKKTIAMLATVLSVGGFSQAVHAGNDPWIGEITTVGFNFCPRGWAEANGQLLAISQYQALFSLLGTIYGGDGRTTFALPDMRGRTGVHAGAGPGLTSRAMGSKYGAENVTLTTNQMPAHSHTATSVARASNVPADTPDPTGHVNALDVGGNTYHTGGGTVDMASGSVNTTISNAGGGAAHPNMQPSITLNYCIALNGIYPSRN